MKIKKNTMIIGLGKCGCKITKLFADMGYSTMFANGSEQDLKVLGNMKGIYKLDGYDGFGGLKIEFYDGISMEKGAALLKKRNYIVYER